MDWAPFRWHGDPVSMCHPPKLTLTPLIITLTKILSDVFILDLIAFAYQCSAGLHFKAPEPG
jgi:hypothetical protein